MLHTVTKLANITENGRALITIGIYLCRLVFLRKLEILRNIFQSG
jgi:hypothetical protein